MNSLHDFEQGNARYLAERGEKHELPAPPAKRLAIVSCMDARIDVVAQLGLTEGDAHIIRNSGGSAREAIRSLIVSQRYLNTREIAVFHHTDCGMLKVTTPELRKTLKDTDPSSDAIATAADSMDFLEFTDLDGSVKRDVDFLQHHPLILRETLVSGWVYHVESGKIRRVA